MNFNFLVGRIIILLFLVLFSALIWLPEISITAKQDDFLTVRFLDVGQGDSIHIQTPDGYEILIDGGASADVLRELSKDKSFFDRGIDIVIATHPDTDHVGGLVDVLERYKVDYIVQTEVEHDAPAARAFARAASREGAQIVLAKANQEIQVGASTTIRILSPQGDTHDWESNTASIATQIIYGDIEFMLTGDAPASIENYLVNIYGDSLESEVLKLGHHGSKTSTSEIFLNTVNPEFAIVSAAIDSRYGHPHQEVMQRVFTHGAKTFHTGTDGTIVFESDGRSVWVK